jgi:alpha-galactosidase
MAPQNIVLENTATRVGIRVDDQGTVTLDYLLPAGSEPQPLCSRFFKEAALPLIELQLSGEGNSSQKSSKALIGTYIGQRLRYRSHHMNVAQADSSKTLEIELHDEKTKVTAIAHLTIYDKLPFLRSRVTVRNDATAEDLVVYQVPSVVIGGMTRSAQWWHDYEVAYANNTWFREAQWVTRSLPDVGLDDFGIYGLEQPEDISTLQASMATFSVSTHSTFSTQKHLPMGLLKRKDGTESWLWQIEHNGSWNWELGDWHDNLYIAASGPDNNNHDWRQRLAPGASFTTVPVSVCHLYGDDQAAFAALTQYRRHIRRQHADNQRLPIIFNDYMNCLMGDPTDEKILALVGPVAKSGAEFFVIDCGWYADDSNWWDDVGLWEPSKRRFPMGFDKLLGKIREAGLRPGLWLEPEVIGVRSPMADRLPFEAFFQREGKRIVEKGRYQLDFRHPEVTKFLDSVVDRCVQEYGAGYFKFDYNIEVTQGTDIDSTSSGAGQLGHNRAYLAWVNRIFDRYPDLVIESCSSGAQRMDYAMLATHPLQSTSDQQYPVHYAAIAAGVATAVTPEQSATWAYPQGDWSDEINALTVVNSLLGRIHLSGRLDTMKPHQLDIVYEGMKVYQEIRGDIPDSTPFWPLGLPSWHDDWLALGLNAGAASKTLYVSVWRRGGSTSFSLPIRPFEGQASVKVDVLYPTKFSTKATWDASSSTLQIELPETICARLIRLQV